MVSKEATFCQQYLTMEPASEKMLGFGLICFYPRFSMEKMVSPFGKQLAVSSKKVFGLVALSWRILVIFFNIPNCIWKKSGKPPTSLFVFLVCFQNSGFFFFAPKVQPSNMLSSPRHCGVELRLRVVRLEPSAGGMLLEQELIGLAVGDVGFSSSESRHQLEWQQKSMILELTN